MIIIEVYLYAIVRMPAGARNRIEGWRKEGREEGFGCPVDERGMGAHHADCCAPHGRRAGGQGGRGADCEGGAPPWLLARQCGAIPPRWICAGLRLAGAPRLSLQGVYSDQHYLKYIII